MTPEIYDRKTTWTDWLLIGAGVGIILLATTSAFASDRTRGTLLPHPAGCPARAFCGCGAAVEIFNRPIRNLWPSVAWFKFPKAAPAPNRVAVRKGHVFVLKQHIGGNVWLVADFNSGGGKSRLHQRSIAGYTIVDPHSRMAVLQ